ncbi:MAG TPA: LysM domain-containing protein, partial [Phenylobacterium sp.]|nr:LysM domain-containing protein [Phenylobacterium sp.]
MTRFPCRSALILVATTALFGAVAAPSWAQMPRPNFPIRQDASSPEARTTPAPEAPAVREERPMPAQPEPEGVQSRPLDPPAVRREPPPPATTPAFAPPPVRTVTKATVTGRVVQAQGPGESYKVKKGDHLATIARKMGVDLEDLARINGLKSPYRLMPG